jgi:hypothetical protein
MDTRKESVQILVLAMKSGTPTFRNEADLKKVKGQPLSFPLNSDVNNLEVHCLHMAGLLSLSLSTESIMASFCLKLGEAPSWSMRVKPSRTVCSFGGSVFLLDIRVHTFFVRALKPRNMTTSTAQL